MYERVIYWFKRDLRIEDNRAFYETCAKASEIIPIFIFVPSLLDRFRFWGERLGFLIDCLKALDRDINKKGGLFYCFYGEPKDVLSYLIERYKVQAIFSIKSLSYTDEDMERKVITLCKEKGISYHAFNDDFLSDLESIPYRKVFSHFYKEWKKYLSLKLYPAPERINVPRLDEPTLELAIKELRYRENPFWKSDFAKMRLESFDFKSYEGTRNRLDIDGSSKLSPYIRFGVVSLRKIYIKALELAGEDCQFIKELAWREFWYHIKNNFPEFRELEFQERRRGLKWLKDEKLMRAFTEGETGYPIIDASIRQLKLEGWIHNRARMIVASFLTKDLLIDWREGERFFGEHLIDYDDVVNIGNWQWNASVGPDPKPLRIFNPIIQARKFDPDGTFIKKYLPELRALPPQMLHDPLRFTLSYHRPIVNHYERVIAARNMFYK